MNKNLLTNTLLSKLGNMLKKIEQLMNQRVRVQLKDQRNLIGTMKGFDKHTNIVLADCEEIRRLRGNRETKRILGFVLLRGEHIVSMTIEGILMSS